MFLCVYRLLCRIFCCRYVSINGPSYDDYKELVIQDYESEDSENMDGLLDTKI